MTPAAKQAISLASDILNSSAKAGWSADWPFDMAQGVLDLADRVKELEDQIDEQCQSVMEASEHK